MTKLMQRALITGWLILALFLMSSLANAQTTVTQQGVFTIIQTPTQTTVCVRTGNVIQCQ